MSNSPNKSVVTIRPAVPEDADGIARTFLESAEYHACLDPERYSVPALETIVTRYREGQQHPQNGEQGVTLVAELNAEIVGFVDARLFQPQDPMHRAMTFCHVSEIAVRRQHQSQGIGGQLMRAAQEWGRQQGAQCALLEYHAANQRGGVFYQRMGYNVATITAIKSL
jgi:ribosomal protein S18 acetylase RimI-like enzyme